MVGKVIKLDMNTDSRARGRFARMAVYVDLEKPLVSQILINEILVSMVKRKMTSKSRNTIVDGSEKNDENYGPWMIIERKSRQKFRENMLNSLGLQSETNAEMGLYIECEVSTFQAKSKIDGRDRNEVVVEVESFDSGKHSVVVFNESKNSNNKNSALSLNNTLGLSPVVFSSSGKGFRNKGRGITKKQNKILHGNNTRFKTSGSQRVSLKELMEQLAESILAFSKDKFDSEMFTKSDELNERVNLPGQ
ncbi:hypothetical protein GOBAR_AA13604 [Gossypium barbadense]|uniref:Uncharacterized protein n=1 Tax=Gossypium barbadense TaxID=3634 RepID=A0A2P5XUM0_GOSBA|nr:hypothetical protein GOBAR_AA13604 [Gossypium barbadense]